MGLADKADRSAAPILRAWARHAAAAVAHDQFELLEQFAKQQKPPGSNSRTGAMVTSKNHLKPVAHARTGGYRADDQYHDPDEHRRAFDRKDRSSSRRIMSPRPTTTFRAGHVHDAPSGESV
jgi:hypothetical protein